MRLQNERSLADLTQRFAHVEACLRESKRFLDDLVTLAKTGGVQMDLSRADLDGILRATCCSNGAKLLAEPRNSGDRPRQSAGGRVQPGAGQASAHESDSPCGQTWFERDRSANRSRLLADEKSRRCDRPATGRWTGRLAGGSRQWSRNSGCRARRNLSARAALAGSASRWQRDGIVDRQADRRILRRPGVCRSGSPHWHIVRLLATSDAARERIARQRRSILGRRKS